MKARKAGGAAAFFQLFDSGKSVHEIASGNDAAVIAQQKTLGARQSGLKRRKQLGRAGRRVRDNADLTNFHAQVGRVTRHGIVFVKFFAARPQRRAGAVRVDDSADGI